MCNISGVIFGTANLSRAEVEGKRVLEVGSRDVNGSLRLFVESLQPNEYVGIDIQEGKGVDQVCDVEELESNFGKAAFDVVIATELLEHVRDWRKAIQNIKSVCKPGGVIIATTRSKGFQYHAWPDDYWRYEAADMEKIFSDCEISALKKDEKEPGIFLKAIKPFDFQENDLENIELYCIVTDKKQKFIDKNETGGLRFLFVSMKGRVIDHLIKFGKWIIKTG